MENRKVTLIDTFINFIPGILAFLMPVFFLPITSEFFELNKLALLTISTVAMLALWIVKMIVEKKVYLTKSPLDVGLVAFFIVALLSSIFSLHKVSSVFGSYGRWFPSLFGFAVLIGFYYALSANVLSVKAVRRAIQAFIAGATASTLVGLLSYFGIRLGSALYFQQPSFTLTGSSTSAALLAGVASVITLSFIVNSKNIIAKVVYLQALLVNALGVILLGSLPIYLTLVIGLIGVFYFSSAEKIKENRVYLLGLAGIVAALVAIFVIPTTRGLLINSSYPKEIVLPARESQVVAFSVLRDFPLIGSGLSTFYLNFPMYRPMSLNAGELWNIRFDKPYSEIFSVIASMGILGIIVTLWLGSRIVKIILAAKHTKDEDGMLVALGSGLVVITASFIFTYASVLSAYLLFALLGMTVGTLALLGEKKYAKNVNLTLASLNVSADSLIGDGDEKTELLPYIVGFPLVALMAFGMYQFSRTYLAEYYMRQAIVASINNDGVKTYDMQARAINTNSQRDSYHNAYAQTSILLANSLAGRENLTDDDKATIQNLIAQAIQSSRIVTEMLSPVSVSGWETRAYIYRNLIGAAQDADQWAIGAYNTAIQIDPTNPRLRLDLGGVYYAKGDYLNAANLFKQAVTLKQDYANARYNFAHSLVQLKSYADAQRELEIVQKLTSEDSEDYKKVMEDLNNVKNLAAQAGAQTSESKPTVDQIQASTEINENETTENQEPLVRPGQEENVNTPVGSN